MSQRLESEVEQEGSRYAERRGWLVVKHMQASVRGWPDREYIRRGRTLRVEWKRLGEQPTEQQLLRHKEIRDHGGEVEVIDSVELAYELFK